jgi:hypothetical protein
MHHYYVAPLANTLDIGGESRLELMHSACSQYRELRGRDTGLSLLVDRFPDDLVEFKR